MLTGLAENFQLEEKAAALYYWLSTCFQADKSPRLFIRSFRDHSEMKHALKAKRVERKQASRIFHTMVLLHSCWRSLRINVSVNPDDEGLVWQYTKRVAGKVSLFSYR